MTSSEIYHRIHNRLFTTHKYVIGGAYIFSGWESDYFGMTEAGYLYEVEIKISRSDFKKDFEKVDKHRMLAASGTHYITNHGVTSIPVGPDGTRDWKSGIRVESSHISIQKIEDIRRPNCFYFACPYGLIEKKEIPEYAGLIYVSKDARNPIIIKKAPMIDKIKRDMTKILLDKFYYRNIQLEQSRNIH